MRTQKNSHFLVGVFAYQKTVEYAEPFVPGRGVSVYSVLCVLLCIES